MPNTALQKIREATRGTEFENRLWLVGGCVRDELLGGPEPNDYDLVLEGDALALADLLWERKVSSIPPVVYPRFGTAMLQVDRNTIELVTAREENYLEESRKPVVTPATLEADARRRDFTINTLLKNLHTDELRDPTGMGLDDLRNRVLRAPVDSVKLFSDDPLRMLRVVRFRWQLDLTPVAGLYDTVRAERERLKIISAERIRDEWSKMLLLGGTKASGSMRDLDSLGLLEIFAPEFLEMHGVDQGKWHHLDVWEHTLLVVENLDLDSTNPQEGEDFRADSLGDTDRLTLVLAALFHDVAKPRTRVLDEQGQIRFFGHEVVGGAMTSEMLTRLRFDTDRIEAVKKLVRSHMRLASFDQFTPSAARRLIRDMDGKVDLLFRLVEADANSLRPGVKVLDLAPVRAMVEEVARITPASQLESPLSGTEIMELTGLPPGPEIGNIKAMLTEKVLEGELPPGDKESALALVKSFVTISS